MEITLVRCYLVLLLLQAAEFMGSDPLMAALGLRLALIAYPVVALSKVSWQQRCCAWFNLCGG